MLKTIQVDTPNHSVMVDITDAVSQRVKESGVKNGVCMVYVPHTTAGVTINEGMDPTVTEDIMSTLEKVVPWRSGYKHTEGNAAAHIKAMLTGGSCHVIIDGGRLMLGTWQRIFFCEYDGPRTRKILIKIIRD